MQTIFKDENSIIAAIEEAQAKAANQIAQSVTLEDEAKELIRYGKDDDERAEGGRLRQKSRRMERAAQRTENELLRLKDALAAFRTEVLPTVIQGKDKHQVAIPS